MMRSKDVLGLVSNYDKKLLSIIKQRRVKVGETIKVPDTNNILKDVVKINVPKGVCCKNPRGIN